MAFEKLKQKVINNTIAVRATRGKYKVKIVVHFQIMATIASKKEHDFEYLFFLNRITFGVFKGAKLTYSFTNLKNSYFYVVSHIVPPYKVTLHHTRQPLL